VRLALPPPCPFPPLTAGTQGTNLRGREEQSDAAFMALTCGFGLAAGLSGQNREANRAQAEVVSGAPTTTESALTSGYLLVEARSPLPGPTRRRPEHH
jgi:hypothetical protein